MGLSRHNISGLILALLLAVLATACGRSAGEQWVFVTGVNGDPEIAVVDVTSGDIVVITDNQSRDLFPRWSPDGSRIVYVADESGDLEINLVDPKDEAITRLTHNAGGDLFPRWSPDGRRLAFVSEREGEPGLYLMEIEGGKTTRIDSKTAGAAGLTGVAGSAGVVLGDWSPNGEWIVFHTEGGGVGGVNLEERGLWLRNPLGVDLHHLTNGQDREPVWSPDGSRVAFVRWEDGNADIYVLRKSKDGDWQDAPEVTRLTQHEAADRSPNWSPDARSLVFVSFQNGSGEIYSMMADGSKQRRLTNNGADDLTPDWSPDGRRIAFVSQVYGQSEIFVMNADGSQQRRLTNNDAEDLSPNW